MPTISFCPCRWMRARRIWPGSCGRPGRIPWPWAARSALRSGRLPTLRDRTIWQSPILVLGYGRVGRAVARRLQVLGAVVTVAARSPEQRAGARCAGCRAADLTQLRRLLPGFDAVVNTIPASVLGREELSCLPQGALVIDLASMPGGTDFAAAKALGIRAEHALSLPARYAPQTAGELVADTVLNILEERGERE